MSRGNNQASFNQQPRLGVVLIIGTLLTVANCYGMVLAEAGESVASGTYFYQLQAGDYLETKKMVILK